MSTMIQRFFGSALRGLRSAMGVKPSKPATNARREPKLDPEAVAMAQAKTHGRERDSKAELERLLAAARGMPDLTPIEWGGDGSGNVFVIPRRRAETPASGVAVIPAKSGIAIAAASAAPVASATPDDDPRTYDARRRKIRDRYISARCPGVARDGADLRAVEKVIKSARLHFEAGESAAALELLDLAIEEAPNETSLSLARIEILFLARDREGFVAGARAFREAHPAHDAWIEIQRLGRALAPGDALFGAAIAARDHEHYGPWPHLPNWIQAPWDLTAEVVAADFHRAMLRLITTNPPLLAAA